MEPTFAIRNTETGKWYAGTKKKKGPVCDAKEKEDAIELEQSEIDADFPNGLPVEWEKVPYDDE